jgi:lipopolysaccharide export system protein LptA
MTHSPRLRPPLASGFFVGLALSLILLAAVSRVDAQEQPLVVEGDQVTYDQEAQMVEAAGNVRLRYRGIRLDADRVMFDLQRELLTAEGHVVLVDPSGRELRGTALRYDVRLGLAEVRQAEMVVNSFYVRSEQLQSRPAAFTATEAMLTPCPPARPVVRITAQRLEFYPGDKFVATNASLWVGRYRLITLPVYTVSLRSGEETAESFSPRFGYSGADGLWGQYVFGYTVGSVRGRLLTKYGTRSGLIPRNSLTYSRAPLSIDLTIGRNQDDELRIFDQAEVSVAQAERPLGAFPAFYTLELRGGWFEEATTGLRATRAQYGIGFRVPTLTLAPHLTFQGTAAWSDAVYGTGDRQGIVRANLGFTQELSPRRSLLLSYNVLEVLGGTPFLLDAVDPTDLVNKATLVHSQTGTRGPVSTVVNAGGGYDFRSRSPLLILGYGEHLTARYHWGVTAEYNLHTTDTELTVGVGRTVGNGTYATVQGIYHTLTSTFEDLDFIVTSRLCDCLDLTLVYRHTRQEIWLEVGLAAAPQSRFQLLAPRP